jgi:hypothetical protein
MGVDTGTKRAEVGGNALSVVEWVLLRIFQLRREVKTMGKFYFGGGAGSLDKDGIHLVPELGNVACYKSGYYDGNGGTGGRQITTGFACKFFIIQPHPFSDDYTYTCLSETQSCGHNPGTSGNPHYVITAVHLHATDGFVVGDGQSYGNKSGVTYKWIALG